MIPFLVSAVIRTELPKGTKLRLLSDEYIGIERGSVFEFVKMTPFAVDSEALVHSEKHDYVFPWQDLEIYPNGPWLPRS